MRKSGLVVVAIAVALTACNRSKAPSGQIPASTQTAVSAIPTTVPVAALAPSVSAEPTNGSAPLMVLRPLVFTPAKDSKTYKQLTLKADGTISNPEKVVAKLVGNELLDDDGSKVASVAPDGTISVEGSKAVFRFNAQDELEGPEGLKIALGDDGIPTITEQAGATPKKDFGQFTTYDPKARRAGEIVLATKLLKKAAKAAKPKEPDGKGDGKKKKKKDKSK